MEWITPKTNWSVSYDSSGAYTGDRFNASDYNRIKNNLIFLRELGVALYKEFEIESVSADKTEVDYFYADEINALERNFNTINANTVNGSYGSSPTYTDNGATMTYSELNRLESAMLDLYTRFNNVKGSRRMFAWHFGRKGVF